MTGWFNNRESGNLNFLKKSILLILSRNVISLQLQSITLRKYNKHKEYKDKTKQIIEETIIAYYQQEGQSFC